MLYLSNSNVMGVDKCSAFIYKTVVKYVKILVILLLTEEQLVTKFPQNYILILAYGEKQ